MLIDGRNIPRGTTLLADVVIVGAGPAGLTAAREIADAGGRVLLLEAAGRRHAKQDDDGLRGVNVAEPFPLVASRHRGFGGTSTHWTSATGLRLRPLDAVDMEPTPFRPNDSWPINRDALDPFYARAHESLGAVGDYEAGPPTIGRDLDGPGGPGLAMFQFVDHDTFTSRYDEVVAHPRIQLALHSPVRRIELEPGDGRVTSLVIAGSGGGEFRACGRVVCLAAGGLDNPRLLLASAGLVGSGVGNEHDLVGRFFMDHLSVDAGVISPLGGRMPDVDGLTERSRNGARYEPMLWLGEETIRRRGLANAAFWVDHIDPRYQSAGVGGLRTLRHAMRCDQRSGLASTVASTVRGSADIIRFGLNSALGRREGTVLGLRIMIEQQPNPASRVRLSSQLDRFGIPRLELDYRITDGDRQSIVEHYRALGDELERAGIARLSGGYDPERHPSPLMTNYHHCGGTRMHADATKGVVDVDGRVHTSPNLFVLGSSVFPTAGYVNPTLTIIAMAHRAADEVTKDMQPLTVRTPSETASGPRATIARSAVAPGSLPAHVGSAEDPEPQTDLPEDHPRREK